MQLPGGSGCESRTRHGKGMTVSGEGDERERASTAGYGRAANVPLSVYQHAVTLSAVE